MRRTQSETAEWPRLRDHVLFLAIFVVGALGVAISSIVVCCLLLLFSSCAFEEDARGYEYDCYLDDAGRARPVYPDASCTRKDAGYETTQQSLD